MEDYGRTYDEEVAATLERVQATAVHGGGGCASITLARPKSPIWGDPTRDCGNVNLATPISYAFVLAWRPAARRSRCGRMTPSHPATISRTMSGPPKSRRARHC